MEAKPVMTNIPHCPCCGDKGHNQEVHTLYGRLQDAREELKQAIANCSDDEASAGLRETLDGIESAIRDLDSLFAEVEAEGDTIRSFSRGHEIVYDQGNGVWLYADDRSPTAVQRPCIKCGKMATPEGYDPCLGHIEGAKAACCGHGVEPGYVLHEDGRQEETETLK